MTTVDVRLTPGQLDFVRSAVCVALYELDEHVIEDTNGTYDILPSEMGSSAEAVTAIGAVPGREYPTKSTTMTLHKGVAIHLAELATLALNLRPRYFRATERRHVRKAIEVLAGSRKAVEGGC